MQTLEVINGENCFGKILIRNSSYINRLIFAELLKRIYDGKKNKAHQIWNQKIIDFKKIY